MEAIRKRSTSRMYPGLWMTAFLPALVVALLTVGVSFGATALAAPRVPGEAQETTGTTLAACVNCALENITVGANPSQPVFDPANGDIYVANTAGSNVSVISGATQKLIDTIPVGSHPDTPTVDTMNGNIYVSNFQSSNVSVISGTTNAIVATIPVAGPNYDPRTPAFDSANGDLYVSIAQTQGTVAVISGSSNTVLTTIPVGQQPEAAVYDPGNGEIYVVNEDSYNMSVLSGATNTVVASVPVGVYAWPPMVDPDNGDLYVANGNYLTPPGNITVVSGSSNKDLGNITVGDGPATPTYVPANREIYVPEIEGSNLTVISGATNHVVGSVTVGEGPLNGAYDPLDGDLYITGVLTPPTSDGIVSAVNVTTNTVAENISVEVFPSGAAVDSFDGQVYSANGNTSLHSPFGSVSVISPATPPSSGPTITSFGAVPPSITLGSWTNFTVSASGGTGTLGYAYAGLPTGCTTSDVPKLACHPTATGMFDVRVYVNDTASHSANALASLTVVPPSSGPTISFFTASPTPGVVGETTVFSVSASGGTGTLSYAYTGLPPACSSQDTPTLSCTPTSWGTFSVRVYVNDTADHSATTSLVLNVQPATSGTISLTSFAATPWWVDVGSPTTIAVAASGGTGTVSYAYTGLPTGCSTQDAHSLSCTPGAAASYTIRVYVNDTSGDSATTTTFLLVSLAPTIDSFTVSPSEITLGQQANFSIVATGGIGTLSYSYSGLPGGCSSTDLATLPCIPLLGADSVGTFEVRGYANDTTGRSASQTTNLTVNAVPPSHPLASVAISPTSLSMTEGTVATFTATPSCTGGPCPTEGSFEWNLTNSLASLSPVPAPGYEVTVTAGSAPGTDTLFVNTTQYGKTVQSAPVTITIVARGPSKLFGLPTTVAYAAIAGVVLAVLLVAAVVFWRRRRGGLESSGVVMGGGAGTEASSPKLDPYRGYKATGGEEPAPEPTASAKGGAPPPSAEKKEENDSLDNME